MPHSNARIVKTAKVCLALQATTKLLKHILTSSAPTMDSM